MELQEGRLQAAEAVAWGTALPGTSFFFEQGFMQIAARYLPLSCAMVLYSTG
jgi:hypothetical protein